eukprot:scaffold33140_cov101-Isochrysis_galbana.AAC.4
MEGRGGIGGGASGYLREALHRGGGGRRQRDRPVRTHPRQRDALTQIIIPSPHPARRRAAPPRTPLQQEVSFGI